MLLKGLYRLGKGLQMDYINLPWKVLYKPFKDTQRAYIEPFRACKGTITNKLLQGLYRPCKGC